MNRSKAPKCKIIDVSTSESSEGETDDVVSGRGCANCVRGTPMWRYNDGSKWMGCNTCQKWFHKCCVDENYESLTEKEIKKLSFTCLYCEVRGSSAKS